MAMQIKLILALSAFFSFFRLGLDFGIVIGIV